MVRLMAHTMIKEPAALPSPKSSPKLPRTKKLTANDLCFVNFYLTNGRNALQAYRQLHPKASIPAATVSASRQLNKANVQAEIATRLRHTGAVTREMLNDTLLDALQWAKDAKDAMKVTAVVRELGELGGLKVQKVEDVTDKKMISPSELADELRKRALTPVPHN